MASNDTVLLETRLGPGEESRLEDAAALELKSEKGYRIIVNADMGIRPEVVSCGPLVCELYASADGRVWDDRPFMRYEINFRQVKKSWRARSEIVRVPLHDYVKPVVRNAPANHRIEVRITGRAATLTNIPAGS